MKFQFYDSPIKSMTEYGKYVEPEKFQFYDSPIKRFYTPVSDNSVLLFQFYDSPIKSIYVPYVVLRVSHCFNSMIVRLKACRAQLLIC